MFPRLFLTALLALAQTACANDQGRDHGVVLLYHHVSADTPAVTSVTPARFEAHLQWLDEQGFEVWPLARLLRASIDGDESVPENVVAITFDDAYESVHAEAWPRLKARGWPFTVFVNTDAVDAGHQPYMNWDQLRELAAAGAAIENHSATHAHLIAREGRESRSDWRERVRADISTARERITEETGKTPTLFAYPYGEDSQALAEIVDEHNEFGLAQRSGAVGPRTDRLSVPRFPMASGFDGMERFALAVNARPLPVTESEPAPPGDGVRSPVESLRLELAEGDYRHGQIGCFSGGGQQLEIDLEAGPPHVLQIEIGGAGSTGRNKINCTAPATDGSGDYFWYSFQWVQDAVRD
ncbi:polysaccharide deacetylase family protein [Wenzhouxiangella sp. XN201]|uniref:polysaccharide deacetylase family protein n=1 Tax=Wenzhouxiangella sp. XN201 TaxID=2710755 RepID=UPI0013CC817E|nr:polysaccharide deacetylase family protein [Wenzhouxiangella sp. XN201]NEZ04259.1 polysaccharide deacetylase family protein [Wenzhouxiangella sp. XN201]